MPIRVEEGKTPKGRRIMVAHVEGLVTLAEAEAMGRELLPGQRFHQGRLLNIVAKGTEYDAAARRHFQSFNGNYEKMAVVVTSALVRAAINFMVRVTAQKIPLQMFSSEAEAIAWLDA